MTNLNRLVFPSALLAALTALPAVAADDTPLKGDLAQLQGDWTTKLGPRQTPSTVTIKGSDVTIKLTTPDGQEITVSGAIKLDETAKPHKTVDWVKFKGPNGDAIPENLGIYEVVDKDTFRFCNGGPGKERPAVMKEGEGGQPHLIVMTRKGSSKPVPEPGSDLATLQGTWTARVGPEKKIPVALVFKGTEVSFVITLEGEDRTVKGDIKLDESARPHKTIDWVNFKGLNGEDVPANLGIYKFEGDKFTVCSGGPGNPRPADFRAGEDGPPTLTTFSKKTTNR